MKKSMTLPMVLLAVAAFVSSCGIMEEDHCGGGITGTLKTLTIDFGWEKIDATAIPEAMRVAFYPADEATQAKMSQGYIFYDLPKATWPATIQLPAGNYHVTAWNNDTRNIIVEGYDNQATLAVTTPVYEPVEDIAAILDSIYDGQRTLDWPDCMVHANKPAMPVFDSKGTQAITLHPDSMIATVEYRVWGIAGLSRVRQIQGAVNNMSGKRYMSYPNLTESSVAVMFDCQYSEQDSLVYGRFHVFGVKPPKAAEELRHKLILFFWMDSGKVYIPIDVMDQHVTSQDARKTVIEIPPLNIDLKDYTTSGGFNVGLDEWQNEDIDVWV